ncbi:MAG: FHA domain-containing protein, partial [Pirellulales bacterium]
MATIEFLSGPRAKEFVELSDPHTLLGRQSFCDIVIDVQGVSRQHARISHGDDGYTIEDLGSVNGTYVNKRRIRERQTLRDQDRILLFRVSAVFHLKTPAAPSSNGHPHVPEEETTSNILPGHDSDVIHAVPVNPELAPAGSTQAQLLAILAITRELATSLDVDQMLPRLLDCLFEVFPQVHNGHVLLRDEASGDLLPEAIRQGRE